MNTLRTLQLVGAIAQVVGGLAGAGIGVYRFKEIIAEPTPKLDVNDDFNPDEIDLTVDCTNGTEAAENN